MTGIAIISALTLVGCSSPDASAPAGSSGAEVEKPAEAVEQPAAPLDLTGTWKQTNSSGDAYMVATVDGATITAQYVNDVEDTTALFWAGTFVPPTDDSETYSWDSVNDTAQTEKSILASPDPTKTFEYADGVLMFPMSLMGVTKTVELERE